MYDIILFTDLTNANVPFKTMGAYKIAKTAMHMVLLTSEISTPVSNVLPMLITPD